MPSEPQKDSNGSGFSLAPLSVLYLIFPIIIAAAFAVRTGDTLLSSLGTAATGTAKTLAVAAAALLIGGAILLIMLGVRRIGKN